MANVFTRTPVRSIKRNTFNLSHDVKLSFDMGRLVPTLIQECIPGDSFTIKNETLIRFAPMVAPVMHSINVHTHYFFVPNRIVYGDWSDFISADLSKEMPPQVPHLVGDGDFSFQEGSLGDYFGLPTNASMDETARVSAIPFGAFKLIYDEYYRDENLQDPLPALHLQTNYKYPVKSGSNTVQDWLTKSDSLPRRAWRHDYFTSALPFAQKGPSVDIPIGDFSDVGLYASGSFGSDERVIFDIEGFPSENPGQVTMPVDDNETPGMYAKTSDLVAGAASINDLRVAFRLQEWFEKAARGGSRYIEQIRVHFDVRSSDARLNRPEFLGGSRHPVIISEVLQTSSTDEVSPQGDMAGHGIAANSGGTVRYHCEEHGYIIGITSVTPTTAYQQGLPRHFSRVSWEDYAWPTFAHLGEQAIHMRELIFTGDEETDESTFGYTPRYSEYRYTPSRVAGQFRTSLSYWHLGRIFTSMPALNASFIECNPRKDIFAVTNSGEHSLWSHVFNKVFVKRKLPRYGAPML